MAVAVCLQGLVIGPLAMASLVELLDRQFQKSRNFTHCPPVLVPVLQLIEPAVNGTRNVMVAAAKHKHTLKRVVVTSSVAGGSTAMPCPPSCS